MTRSLGIGLALIALLAAVTSAAAQATASPQLLLREVLSGMPRGDKQEVRVLTAGFKPGDKTVFHTHRFPVIVYVLEGAFTLELEGRAPITVKALQTQLKAIKKWGRSAPADLSKITEPTLIANGDNDRMVPSVLSEDLHRRIPGSELIIFPDSGHGGIFQFHDKFAPIAVQFLDR